MDLTQIRAGLTAHGTPTRGRRYPPELRDGIRVHICSARATGQSWASLARVNGHTNCTTVRPQTRYHPAQAKRAHAREVARSANKRTRAYTHT